MSQPLVYKGVTVAPPTMNAVSLLSLLVAVDSSIVGYAREMYLQPDPSNTTNILVGDDQLTTSRVGYILTPTSTPRNYRDGNVAGIPLSNIFVLAVSGAPKLNVEILL